MNSLEDAFVNIGMEEQEEDEKATAEKFTDFSDIVIPPCITEKSPEYSFQAQFQKLFYRKYLIVTRSVSLFFTGFLPIVFQTVGVLLAYYVATPSKYGKYAGFWQMILIGIYNVLAYCCFAGNQAGYIAIERESNIKYALNVMGMRNMPYFLATFCFDYLVFIANYVIYIGISYIFQIEGFIERIGQMSITFLIFGIAMVWGNYASSYMFRDGLLCQKLIFWFNYICLFSLPLMFALIDSLVVQQITAVITPYTAFYYAFFQMIPPSQIPPILSNYKRSPFEQIWIYWIIIACHIVLNILLTMYFSEKKHSIKMKKVAQQSNQDKGDLEQTHQVKDISVIKEEKRILNQRCDDAVQVRQLTKTYPNGFQAIKDSTFSVKRGEIFGLLGPNGAGKSTTFNILTSLIPKSGGSVLLNGVEVSQGEMDIYQNVGITPQFDPIWEVLTVREHLKIFGGMKGLKGKDLEDSINYFIQVMQLKDYENVKAGVLSGGNKRKLCVTMALIGGPNMQFFDEPSTGLDPIARRFLWNTLKNSLQLRNSAIVLTTHSMHEAETLCDKLGILINGQFKCIGTPAELKQVYGQGFNVQVQLFFNTQKAQKSMIRKMFLSEFTTSQDLSSDDNTEQMLMFKIPNNDFSFYKTYSFFMKSEFEGIIKDFGIHQSSLEQIFIYFSQFQKDTEAQNQQDINEEAQTNDTQIQAQDQSPKQQYTPITNRNIQGQSEISEFH